MPLFALANAGVVLDGTASLLANRVALGVIVGLLIGKPLGVMLFSWVAMRSGVAELPAGATWRSVFGVSCLAGIGLTMSLFVGSLAFGDSPLFDAANVGILLASAVAGIVGWRVLSSNL